MKYVIGYIRVSAKETEKEEYLKIKEDILVEFCKKNNFKLLNIFYDEKSEKNENLEERTGLILALDQVKVYEKSDTPVSYLIGEKSDTFAQDKILLGYIQFELARHNCSVFSIAKEKEDEILINIGTAFAVYEKEMLNAINRLKNKEN